MVKKISIVVFVITVLAAGYFSLKKLNYLERSAAIFKFDSSSQSFEGRGGRGRDMYPGSRERLPQEGRISIPDSLRGRRNLRSPGGSGADSFRPQNSDFTRMRRDTINNAGNDFGGRNRRPEGFGGHGDRRGKTINLNMVAYYLGVFALFTLIVVYIEKGYRLIFKNKKLIQEESDLII
jgi:hypothetical protein